MTIIRIEHDSDGKGLWRSRGNNISDVNIIDFHTNYQTIADRHIKENGFPNFYNDEKLYNNLSWEEIENYHFAFKSLEQLKTALTSEELKECIEVLGFKVWMLDVTDYVESDYQIVFKKSSISMKKDISALFL